MSAFEPTPSTTRRDSASTSTPQSPGPEMPRGVAPAIADGFERPARGLAAAPRDAGAIEYASWLPLLQRAPA